jgi:hypothetical protein
LLYPIAEQGLTLTRMPSGVRIISGGAILFISESYFFNPDYLQSALWAARHDPIEHDQNAGGASDISPG